ncbi:HAD family hydrolase [Demetria terragena]|uniref:HAD family hydrolase n=1 Tax=Demetria terragena TaxID=63959 RepID=UPI00036907B1|nr:HAD-IA family hydrolase [Demetria terragena]
MAELRPEVKAVLWDADGVLQHGTQDWHQRFTELGGPGFARAVFKAEEPSLRGEEPLRKGIAALLTEWKIDLTVEAMLELWTHVRLDQEAFELIAQVRNAGTPCYLATNQQDYRVDFMRNELGYDRHFDGTYYSSEVGAMKPEPAYFEHVLKDLGLEPHHAVFIDDNPPNIDAAKAIGIRAFHHEPTAGVAGLRRILRSACVAGC